jgi:hypothetical protein
VPKTATVLPLTAIAPRWAAVSTPRAAPLKIVVVGGEIDRQTLGDAGAVRRGMTRANHGVPRLRQNVLVTTDVEHQRRIVDLAEVEWICGIVEGEDLRSGGLRLAHLLLCHFHGLARARATAPIRQAIHWLRVR